MKSLSFSELVRSGGCALAAWRYREARHPEGGEAAPSGTATVHASDALLLGNLAHAVLETTVKQYGWPAPGWQEAYDEAWDRLWPDVRPRTGSRLQDLPNVFIVRASLKRWLQSTADHGLADGGAEAELRLGLPDADVHGIADLVTTDAHGAQRLWDLKTGNTVGALEDDSQIREQLLLYAALLEEISGAPVATIGVIDRLGGSVTDYDRASGTEILARYREAARAMSSPTPPAARVEEASCIRCPWLDTCPDAIAALTASQQVYEVTVAHDHPSGQYLTLNVPGGNTMQTRALQQPNGLPPEGATIYLLDRDGIQRALVPMPPGA